MEKSGKFNFVALPKKTCFALSKKENQDFLLKWGLKGNLKVQYYNFNQEFYSYKKKEFVEDFFADPTVFCSLQTLSGTNWVPLGEPADKVDYVFVPCTVTSMDLFTRLYDETNKILRANYLLQCPEEMINGIYLSDNLRYMLHDNDSKYFGLFSAKERNEFIFHLFKHICLGGKLCQYENHVDPYLSLTKSLYKDLISVHRLEEDNTLVVRSIVLKVTAYKQEVAICPKNPDHTQNFMYLIIEPFQRQVAVLQHQYDGPFQP